jgi:uncharacterized coiled-coil protein SlyX
MNELTLLAYAQTIGKTKKAVECMVARGILKTEKREGIRYVILPAQDTLSIATLTSEGTLEAIPSAVGDCEGIWQAIAEQTELFERLSATIAERERTIKQLNAAINDLLERTVYLEAMRQCDRQELTRIGQAVGAYREPEVRDGRTYESQRARPNVLLGLVRRVTG